jgi:hypothetical protein
MRGNWSCLFGLFFVVFGSMVSMAQNVPPNPPADPGSCVDFLEGESSCEDYFGAWIPNLDLVCNNLCPVPNVACGLANDFEMVRIAEAVYKAKLFWNLQSSTSGFAASSSQFECYRIRQCECTAFANGDRC